MRKYLACLTDEFLEKNNRLTMRKDVRVFEVGTIDFKNQKIKDVLNENEYDIDDVHLMEFLEKEDTNGKELHEGAIVKAKAMYGMGTTQNKEELVGFIEYCDRFVNYSFVTANEYIPITSITDIEKIGIMPIDSNLLDF